MVRWLFTISLFPFPIFAAGCAAKLPHLPAGGGVPFPEFASAYAQATERCDTLRSLTAVLSMSGRAGRQKLRGRIDAGLERPDRIVLEGVAPWGKPFFVLAAAGAESTLVLPRDDRFMRGTPPAAIVEALTGVRLEPAELLTALAGCGMPAGQPSTGLSFGTEWASADAGGTTMWVRRMEGRWRLVAAVRGPLALHYSDFAAAHPSTVRLRTSSSADPADIVLRVSQLELNVPLDPAVFTLVPPAGATPLTLEELRRARVSDPR